MNLLEETKKTLKAEGYTLNCIEWAVLQTNFCDDDIDDIKISLPPLHSKKDLDEFAEKIDFDYDNGYGHQVVYGVIKLTDGSWLERDEYDGAEWWELKRVPVFGEIPQNIKLPYE